MLLPIGSGLRHVVHPGHSPLSLTGVVVAFCMEDGCNGGKSDSVNIDD